MTFYITCVCNTELEVEDMNTIKCFNCGRIYDDRGSLIGYE
jgi:hypothetical protein